MCLFSYPRGPTGLDLHDLARLSDDPAQTSVIMVRLSGVCGVIEPGSEAGAGRVERDWCQGLIGYDSFPLMGQRTS